MQYYVNHIIKGPCSGKQYARKGDVVTLIALHDTMAIVEGAVERFPTQMKNLSAIEVVPETVVGKPDVINLPLKTKSKPVTNPQNNIQSLF